MQSAIIHVHGPVNNLSIYVGSIRPIFSRHRIEVLFWGVRDMKKLQFTAVTKPRIDVECAGNVISSLPLTDALTNPNFTYVITMHLLAGQ